MNGPATTPTVVNTQFIDDFLRRELRIGDPRNASEVANALRTRYRADAARMDQEGSGFAPAFGVPDAAPVVAPSGLALSHLEAQRVQDDLEADFQTVAEEPANRLRQAELAGWKTALMDEWLDARSAAMAAADPAQRERVFYGIRHLSDFARVSRMASAMFPEVFFSYRRLAASLDACGNVLRALVGEALYQAGLSDGGLLLSMSVADLRARRDGLVHAVRLLTGVEREDETWPDALVSYRQLREAILAERRIELMIYLREETLAPILDDFLAETGRNDGKALRGLAATSLVDVNRMGELLTLIARAGTAITPSAALSRLIENLHLLQEFFGISSGSPTSSRRGARLIELAMPIPLISLSSSLDDAPQRRQLAALVSWRHALQAQIDANILPLSTADKVLADQTIYFSDRAIDAFALGEGGVGGSSWLNEEQRAGHYLALIDATLSKPSPGGVADVLGPPPPAPGVAISLRDDLRRIFPIPPAATPPHRPVPDAAIIALVEEEVARSITTWAELVRSLAPR